MAPWRVQRSVDVSAIPRSTDSNSAGGFTQREREAGKKQRCKSRFDGWRLVTLTEHKALFVAAAGLQTYDTHANVALNAVRLTGTTATPTARLRIIAYAHKS